MTARTTTTAEERIAAGPWRAERMLLRDLLLEAGLDEVVKWGKPCYVLDGANVAILFALREYCAIGFFKGALLADPDGVLVAPGENSQAMRQLRFAGTREIGDRTDEIRAFIARAVQAERDGLEIAFEAKNELTYPAELLAVLDKDADFARAFEALTPGRKRGLVIHYAEAKKAETRTARILRTRETVLAGKGLGGR